MPKKDKKARKLSDLLFERGLVATAAEASALVMTGRVSVGGTRVDKPGTPVPEGAAIVIAGSKDRVSRGGLKLEEAFRRFPIDVAGKVCADAGASTGGFTEVLLRRGAARIYAIDTAYGVLDWSLRRDPRVVVMERTSIAEVARLPETAEFVSADVSLVPLRNVLPSIFPWVSPGADVVALVKPQYEAGREETGKGVVISDAAVHHAVLRGVLAGAREAGFDPRGLIPSPILGMGGNKEFLLWCVAKGGAESTDFEDELVIEQAVGGSNAREER